jgi:hypothetical protein
LSLSVSADAADWKHVPDPWRDGDRAHDDPAKKRPLVIKEQGSFFVGGEPFFTETGNDTDIEGDRNPGTATINQSYVEFQIPRAQNSPYPMILLPGGGHFGKVYETTPDGREGWATYFGLTFAETGAPILGRRPMAPAKGEALAVAAPCDLLPLSGQRCGCAQMHRGLRERRRRLRGNAAA